MSVSGKHNGSVKGIKYFECASDKGLFVRPDKISLTSTGDSQSKRLSGGDLRKSHEILPISGKARKAQMKTASSQSSLNSADRLTRGTAASEAKVKK